MVWSKIHGQIQPSNFQSSGSVAVLTWVAVTSTVCSFPGDTGMCLAYKLTYFLLFAFVHFITLSDFPIASRLNYRKNASHLQYLVIDMIIIKALHRKYRWTCITGNSWFWPKKRRNPPFFVKTLPLLTLKWMLKNWVTPLKAIQSISRKCTSKYYCYLSKLRSMMISSPLSSLGCTFLNSSLAEAPVLAWKEDSG